MNFVYTFLNLVLLVCLSGCSGQEGSPRHQEMQQWHKESNRIKVLSTISMIDDMVKEVGGEYVDHITLIKGDLDPHSYQLVKGDDEKLARADIIFYNGLGLEHGPSLQHHLKTSQKAIGLGNRIKESNPSDIITFHGQVDPHIWMDISLWAKTIPYIVEALSRKEPLHAESFRQNGARLQSEMLALHEKTKNRMQAIPSDKRYLVTSHDAFNYFARVYLADGNELEISDWQKRFAAPEGLAPESQLSPSDIQYIIDYMRKYNIHVLFPESNVSKDSIRKILQAGKEKGLDLFIAKSYLYADAMGQPGSDGDTYLKMIEHNVRVLEESLPIMAKPNN